MFLPPALLATLLLATPPASPPPSPEALREETLRRLTAADAPPREADWEPLGPEVLPVLGALVQDAKLPQEVRTRAISAMACLGRLAIPSLAPLLEDRSEQIRKVAAQSLGRLGGMEARRLLEERLTLEESPGVRETIQQGLTHAAP
jgi:HEAT repeat protein